MKIIRILLHIIRKNLSRSVVLPVSIMVTTILLTSSLLVFNILLLNKNKSLQFQKTTPKGSVQFNNDRKLSLWELSSEGDHLEDLLLASGNLDTISINRSLENPMLIFRVPEENCLVCVDSILKAINTHRKAIHDLPFFIITSDKSTKDLKLSSRNFPETFESFRTINHSFDSLTIERSSTPYLFVLEPGLKVTNVFIPDKYYPKGTEQYIKLISFKYEN